jgi:hypothetical protein
VTNLKSLQAPGAKVQQRLCCSTVPVVEVDVIATHTKAMTLWIATIMMITSYTLFLFLFSHEGIIY